MIANVFKSGILITLLTLTFGLSSCKKDALKVNEIKKYYQDYIPIAEFVTPPRPGPIALELRPDKTASMNQGSGDIITNGTYKISGKKLTVKIDKYEYKFTIISEEELHGENGEILKLYKR